MTPGNTGTLIGQSLGGYELLSLLGAGGMAEVYRAKDPKLDREVAVKVLPASLALDAGYVERFRDEARRVAALNHPNVVPVYHYGEERGLLFLVMPVLQESLRDRMERDGLLPVSEATRYVVQVAAALDAAHSQGLVHRDVKPENILINPDGRAMLTDFGIAREASFLKRTGSNRTLAATGLPVGTPEYMAPEQLRAGIVDQRADIYALGAVLYELLTGTVPHEADTPYEVAALVLTAPLTPPTRRNPAIWPQLEQVVMKALASDPNGRYPNTRAFAVAVRDAVIHRDSSVSRLTMPAVSAEIPTLAA
ncbi:MAG TPA: serine/threonine-protein kinase, partial [Ktedonobacterales bacterium]|nr:serine/threonine-protein kinase [Ktedonobacterales bacterium]